MEPFKNQFNKKIITGMAKHFVNAWSDFNDRGFIRLAAKDLQKLELKERSEQIMLAMREFLPDDFEHTSEILLATLAPEDNGVGPNATVNEEGIAGWAIMPMTHYVGLYGLGHFDLSMILFKELTKRFTAEFGIRFFILKKPKRVIRVLKKWVKDSNHHVRRLVSEGVRPRLPWSMQLPVFIEDPAPIILLLEELKDDEEEYVRRSVANNLNDISKDHPDLVARIANQWLVEASTQRYKLVRHACRTLIKQGHIKTLKAFGYRKADLKSRQLRILTPKVNFGKKLEFELSITSSAKKDQALIIDYIIHHQKANGTLSPKVFKWKNLTVAPNREITLKKNHVFKQISTRVYYPGRHRLEIMINGASFGMTDFFLKK